MTIANPQDALLYRKAGEWLELFSYLGRDIIDGDKPNDEQKHAEYQNRFFGLTTAVVIGIGMQFPSLNAQSVQRAHEIFKLWVREQYDELPGNEAIEAVFESSVQTVQAILETIYQRHYQNSDGERDSTSREASFLQAMLRLGATSAATRKTTAEIVAAIDSFSDPETYKDVCSHLKQKRLIDTKGGRGGGAWLTTTGLSVAKR